MKYQKLGRSDLNISEIGLGCMSLPAREEDKTIGIIHRAIELGINYFDTADLYDKGINERILGEALKGKREKVVLATKVGNQWREDGSGWDWNPRKEYILRAAEESLHRLQTDHIDLYQLHGGTIDDPIDETIEAFELLKQEGKIRYYGISSIRPNVIREYVKRSNIVSVMMQYSLADRRPEEEMLNLLQENNVGVLVRGALAQGMLVNKSAKDYLEHSSGSIAHTASMIRSLVNEKRTASQIAIRYVLKHHAVSSAVVGVSRLEQLEEIAGTSDIDPLDEQEIGLLESSIPAIHYEQHR
jgi:aryl-alcohol dehydrogenase-like predicted oxidoreductase